MVSKGRMAMVSNTGICHNCTAIVYLLIGVFFDYIYNHSRESQ